MKRIVSLMLVVIMVLSFVGCSGAKNAKWDGYDKMSLKSYLEKGLKAMASEADEENAKVKVSVEDGWKDSQEYKAEDLEDGEKAVTYKVELSSDEESATYYFFMIYADKVLKSKGLRIVMGEQELEFGAERADALLKELEEYVD